MATVSAHVGKEDGWPLEASPKALTTKEIKALHGKTLISFSLDLLSAFGTPPNGCGNNHNDVDVHVAREINLMGSSPNTPGPNHCHGGLLDHPKTPPNVSNITPLQISKPPLQWLQVLDMIHHGPPEITRESNQIIVNKPCHTPHSHPKKCSHF